MTVHRIIDDMDGLLLEHLAMEDDGLYPALAAAADPALRASALAAAEDMGGLRGIWTWYRKHWTLAAVLADPVRFRTTTDDIVGTLSLRIQVEESTLYPAFAALKDDLVGDAA